MHLNGFMQNAYVTRNLEHAVATVAEHHGIRDWVYFSPEMEVYTATDGYGPCHLKVALGWAGALQLELIEPVWGNLQFYLDYLPADTSDYSPRFHHVCVRVLDWDQSRAEVEAKRWPIAYEGGVEGCKFVYIDTRASLGHYLEYMWMSPQMWAASGGK